MNHRFVLIFICLFGLQDTIHGDEWYAKFQNWMSQFNIKELEPKVESDNGLKILREYKKRKKVRKTIKITSPGVYDFENILHEWNGKGKCNQAEKQPPILEVLVSNVTIKNFAYRNAPDGIHVGPSSSQLRNIKFENVTGWACEDALSTLRGAAQVEITNSRFFGNPNEEERDKILQLSNGDVRISNTSFENSLACVRFKGSQNIVLRNNTFKNCNAAIYGDTVTKSRAWKSGSSRVEVRDNENQGGRSFIKLIGKITAYVKGNSGNLKESIEKGGQVRKWKKEK